MAHWKAAPAMCFVIVTASVVICTRPGFGITTRASYNMINMAMGSDRSLPLAQTCRAEGGVAPIACLMHCSWQAVRTSQRNRGVRPRYAADSDDGSLRGGEGASEGAAPEANGGDAADAIASSSDEELLAARAPTARRKTG